MAGVTSGRSNVLPNECCRPGSHYRYLASDTNLYSPASKLGAFAIRQHIANERYVILSAVRHRNRSADHPFPEAWRRLLDLQMHDWVLLDDKERSHLEVLVRDFIDHKLWEGVSGLQVTEEIQVRIAAHACLLILELDLAHYRDVTSIIVYPTTATRRGERSLGGGIYTEEPSHLRGEALLHGPVMVAWDAVESTGHRSVQGRNVVQHEFAHKLDMLDGSADGVPPIHDHRQREEFSEVTARAYEELAAGEGHAFLDLYATTNRAEFFAVATEAFFNRPEHLLRDRPDLYGVLRSYYRQDPSVRRSRRRFESRDV